MTCHHERKLAIQLTAVLKVLAAVQNEADPDQRKEGEALVHHALAAIQREHEEHERRRASFHVVGGAVLIAGAVAGHWIREAFGARHVLAAGTAAVSASVTTGALVLSVWSGPSRPAVPPHGGQPMLAAPAVMPVPSASPIPLWSPDASAAPAVRPSGSAASVPSSVRPSSRPAVSLPGSSQQPPAPAPTPTPTPTAAGGTPTPPEPTVSPSLPLPGVPLLDAGETDVECRLDLPLSPELVDVGCLVQP